MIPVMRNTLILVDLIEKSENRIGNFIVPSHSDEYTEADVLSVGPGTLSAEGGVSETNDLRVGQRIWIKSKARDPRTGALVLAGIRFQDGDRYLHIFEQSSAVAILAQPGTFPAAIPTAEIVQ